MCISLHAEILLVLTNFVVNDIHAVSNTRVKTWFIVKRLFEPEEPSDAAPTSSDDVPHVTVKVENAVLDGGVTREVTRDCISYTFCDILQIYQCFSLFRYG